MTIITRSPCGVKIFNPPASPKVTPPNPVFESVSAKTSGSSNSDEGSSRLHIRSPSCKSHYLGPYESRAASPTLSCKSSKMHSRANTPTSPMFVKLFTAKLSDYNHTKDTTDSGSKASSTMDESSRPNSPNYHLLSPHTSPCSSPAIREFRKKTSPSLINLKSPMDSRKNSRVVSCSPMNLSPASSISPKSLPNISPEYSNTTSNDSPVFEGDPSPNCSYNGSIFSFNTPDPSTNTTPVLTPVLTPRSSPLSRSLMSINSRPQRSLSPLAMNNPTPGKKEANNDEVGIRKHITRNHSRRGE